MICSNQVREGQNGKTTPGGNAIPFYSTVRIEVKPHYPHAKVTREKTIRGVKQKKVIGVQTDFEIKKRKLNQVQYHLQNLLIFVAMVLYFVNTHHNKTSLIYVPILQMNF